MIRRPHLADELGVRRVEKALARLAAGIEAPDADSLTRGARAAAGRAARFPAQGPRRSSRPLAALAAAAAAAAVAGSVGGSIGDDAPPAPAAGDATAAFPEGSALQLLLAGHPEAR